MSTKPIKTRIQSKIDTLENWNQSTLPLLAGEIAIATGAVNTGVGATEPICIIRIGEDGKKTFSQLPDALHAKAIDVLPICKNTEALKEFILTTLGDSEFATQVQAFFKGLKYEDEAKAGEYVSSVSQDNGVISVTRTAFPEFIKKIDIEIAEHEGIKECIILKDDKGTVIDYVDASRFVKDGMLETVSYDETNHILTLTWNTESEKNPISTDIDLSELVNIYTGTNGITVEGAQIKLSEEFVEQFEAVYSTASTAIQTITSNAVDDDTPSGLKVSKTNTSYDIAIDDSVTFIFNCGNAEVNI